MKSFSLFVLVLACVSPAIGATRELGSADMLRVNGNRIVNAAGEQVILQGVNIPSMEWSAAGENMKDSFERAIRDWKANVIRLPVHTTYWYGNGTSYNKRTDGGAGYRQLVDELVAYANANGCYVLIDLHEYEGAKESHRTFWKECAARYANRPGVIFDVLNEPHGTSWEIWRNGDGSTYIGMQALVDAIRATGAKNMLLCGGLDWAYDLTGIDNGYELADKSGNGIVYATHVYPWKGNSWNQKFLACAAKHPVFVGEVGCMNEKQSYENSLVDPFEWAPKILACIRQNQLSWTAWCLHPKSTPNLVSDWNFSLTPFWGEYALEALRAAANETADISPFAKHVGFTVSSAIGGTVTNLPVLVRLSTAITGFSFADFKSRTGADMLFTDVAGHEIPHEIDTWNPSGVSLVWVRLPVAAPGTSFTLHYGADTFRRELREADVWRPYTGVWHFGEAGGAAADATGHGLTGTPLNESMTAVADGAVGSARLNRATTSGAGYMSIPAYDKIGPTCAFTASGWFRASAKDSYPRLFSRKANYTDADGWEIECAKSTAKLTCRAQGNDKKFDTGIPDLANGWVHLTFAYASNKLTVYANGNQVSSGTVACATDACRNGRALLIGANGSGGDQFTGAYDECRLAPGTYDAVRAKAEYLAMADATFLAAGAAYVAVPGGAGPSTRATPVPVPHAWLDAYPSLMKAKGGDYEAAAKAMSANGRDTVWACYVAGLVPSDPQSEFRSEIVIGPDGTPSVTWTPNVLGRTYRVVGKASFSDASWIPLSESNRTSLRFFKVQVSLE